MKVQKGDLAKKNLMGGLAKKIMGMGWQKMVELVRMTEIVLVRGCKKLGEGGC